MLVSSGSDLLALTQTSHLFNGWREGAAALNLLLNLLGSSLWNVDMKTKLKHKTQMIATDLLLIQRFESAALRQKFAISVSVIGEGFWST